MAEGYMWPPRQQVAVGTADQAQPAGSKWQSARPTRLGLPRTFVLRNYMNDLLFRAQT